MLHLYVLFLVCAPKCPQGFHYEPDGVFLYTTQEDCAEAAKQTQAWSSSNPRQRPTLVGKCVPVMMDAAEAEKFYVAVKAIR
jgi:hypothetical protein